MSIPENHLRACHEHGVVSEQDGDCPCCVTGVEARPTEFDEPVGHEELRWQVEPETMSELIPLVREYLDDIDEGPMWVSVAEVPKRDLAAGYTEQERWFNVLRYRFGGWHKTVILQSDAEETIETLREHGYGASEPEAEVDNGGEDQ